MSSKKDSLTKRTGGAYIPPSKLKLMQQDITDKSSQEYQRISWEALKKSINGLINKVNVSNLSIIVRELFKLNLIRGSGLFCRSVMTAQAASPTFTHVYAALVCIVNSKIPSVGELALSRLINNFKRAYARNDKQACLASTRFIAHLINQQVSHELLGLELLTLLLENPTSDSVEISVGFLKECGAKLQSMCTNALHAVFETLRNILHEGNLGKRIEYMIEVMFAVRKDGFKDHPTIIPELDLLEESDKFTHEISLLDELDLKEHLNVFHFDPNFLENEKNYLMIKKEILDNESSDEDDDDDEDDDGDDDDEEEDQEGVKSNFIVDTTETNLIALRRTIYLTFQSSIGFEECCHKLLKLELKDAQQLRELCYLTIDCCANQRTYIKFYGLLAQRLCLLNQEYRDHFTDIFKECFEKIHRFLDITKMRNVAKFFGHLLFTDSIPWAALSCMHLNEDETTSSSRVFIKILFQELEESMGFASLNARIKDPTLQEAFAGLFPRDNPRNMRFSINFFTSIGLGPLTEDLREQLKKQVAPI